jgi:dCTP diphosphatase
MKTVKGSSVIDLQQAVQQFISDRQWEVFHTPKNLAMSIAIEAAELMEHFQWLTAEEANQRMQDPAVKAAVADELADILIYCLSFANQNGIDVSQAVLGKLSRNESRFPANNTPDPRES